MAPQLTLVLQTPALQCGREQGQSATHCSTSAASSLRCLARSKPHSLREAHRLGDAPVKSKSMPLTRPRRRPVSTTTCGLGDFIGGDLVGLDLGQWCDDVENLGAVGFWAPPEGGAECRYGTSLKYRGYHVMSVSARGLGDPEAYLLKTHGVRPPHLGKQPIATFYQPGEVDLRLSVLPPRYKGIVVWVYEAKVLSKNELQFLALLPALRPQVKVVVEMGGARKFNWKPLKDIVGLPASASSLFVEASPLTLEAMEEKEKDAVAA